MNLGDHFQNQILRQFRHSRPVFDIGTELNFHRRVRLSFAVKNTVIIDRPIKEILRMAVLPCKLSRRCQITLIGRRCGNRPGVHKRYRRNLSVLDLGSLTVGEVSRCMPDAECIVGRGVTRTETGTAERRLYYRTGSQKVSQNSVLCQFHINRSTCGVYA